MTHALILSPEGNASTAAFKLLVESLIDQGYQLDILCRKLSKGMSELQKHTIHVHQSDIEDSFETAILFSPVLLLNDAKITEIEKKFRRYKLVVAVDCAVVEACMLGKILRIPYALLVCNPAFLELDAPDMKEACVTACHDLDFAVCQDRNQAELLAREYHIPFTKLLDAQLRPFEIENSDISSLQTISETQREQTPFEELESLAALIEQGNLAEAESRARSQTVRFPADGISWKLYGAVLNLQGRTLESLLPMQKAAMLMTTDAAAHSNLGMCLNDLDRLDEAESILRQSLALDPTYLQAHNNLGITMSRLGRLEEAKNCYLQALKLNPDCTEAYCNLGVVFKDLGQLKDAETSYHHALKLRPDYSDASNNLALLLNGQGRSIEALNIITQALRIQESGEAKNIFAECIRNAPLTFDNRGLQPYLVRALEEPWGRPVELARAGITLLKLDPCINKTISKAVRSWPARLTESELFTDTTLDALSENHLFCALLNATPVCDFEIERFLTMTRAIMLEKARVCVLSSISSLGKSEAFYTALANQCFINEYVFFCSATENVAATELKNFVIAALKNGREIPEAVVVAVAAYFPLHTLPESTRLLSIPWPQAIVSMLRLQVSEPLEELQERPTIPQLTPVDSKISLLVQDQYENNPYPRWIKTAPRLHAMTVTAFLRQKFPHIVFYQSEVSRTTEILIAGCGTGQHPIGTAQRFLNTNIVAIDLSLSSLCYAQRKSRELGITSIEYAQADILKLGTIGRTFDSIESAGVLHHLADPWKGWSTLLSLLRPGGFMKLGFYSAMARRKITQLRQHIAEQRHGSTADDIRAYRQELFENVNVSDFDPVLKSPDFFSISSCRDLLFHVQEHCLSLTHIDRFLKDNALRLLGFEIDEQVLAAYKNRFPDDKSATNLAQWNIFESDNPDIFSGMYQFWIQKPA